METQLANIWAKTGEDQTWHPLILHMLDTAACTEEILKREPEQTRKRMAEVLGMDWEAAKPWLLVLVACHDLGKASPSFQCKWQNRPTPAIELPRAPNSKVNHAFISQVALEEILTGAGWSEELAELAADAVGCHHGSRASPTTQRDIRADHRAVGKTAWNEARAGLFGAVLRLFSPGALPPKSTISGPDFMLLSGLTSFADWIGSNVTWFPFGGLKDCNNLKDWYKKRSTQARHALDDIGWATRTPLQAHAKTFDQVFNFPPRPLQIAVEKAVLEIEEPAILLLEGPMGEGKTEAAYYAHVELQRKLGHRGLYIALPTKATGNAMFARTINFLKQQGCDRVLDLQLLHGGALLNDTYQDLRINGIYDPETGGAIRAGEWFTNKKRALLSEYGVGTVDQALLSILRVKHQFVRLWGLANRVVVFDEIHAYDAYTGTLLLNLLRWLIKLGSSVILLSATLPPSFRRRLAEAVEAELPDESAGYPRMTVYRPNRAELVGFQADPSRRLTINLQGIPADLEGLRNEVNKKLGDRGSALILVNTVQRAQGLFNAFPRGEPIQQKNHTVGKRLDDGTEVYLFHARFMAEHRQTREDFALRLFGPKGKRKGRRILIATQVVEQSLDLDFDLIATDLAPVDLVLQRAGRLWRHKRYNRPLLEPCLLVTGLSGIEPPPFGKPLWWDKVYQEFILLCSWVVLREKSQIMMPDDIDPLVTAVYTGQVDIPVLLQARANEAEQSRYGEECAKRIVANHAIIGLPEDASWNQPDQFLLYDEDEPEVHRSLRVHTRLGDESVVAIPIAAADEFDPDATSSFTLSKQLFNRGIGISRTSIVAKLKGQGVPKGWRRSPLLRNCYALTLDDHGRWSGDNSVRYSEHLGLVYEPKEDE